MVNTKRSIVIVDDDRPAGIRSLEERGSDPSASAAWWMETLRRCDEAERDPQRLLDADRFFQQLRQLAK